MKINYDRRRDALKKVHELLTSPEHVWFIHYSCESFYGKPEPFSSRVTSISVRRLSDGASHVFSISREISQSKSTQGKINDEQFAMHERSMLDRFFLFLGQEEAMGKARTYIHWGMKSDVYGFSALELRYELVGGVNPYRVKDENKVDLSRLLVDIYGDDYIEKPCLTNLVNRNRFSIKDFLTGAEECERFETQEYSALHLSTSRKVSIFEDILKAIENNELITNASMWNQYRGAILHPFECLSQNPTVNGVIAFYALYEIVRHIYEWLA